MKINGFSHIRKWLLLYLALVMLTTTGLYLSIYMEVTNTLSELNLAVGAGAMAGLELRLLLILSGGLLLSLGVGLIWVCITTRRIGRPVRTIATAMTKLAKGQLNETVIVETSDELEQIGSSINELAANIQELLLYVWKQTGQCHTILDHIHGNGDLLHDRRLTLDNLRYLEQLSAAIDDLREMAKAYVFYDVSIEGATTHAIKEPGTGRVTSKLPSNYF